MEKTLRKMQEVVDKIERDYADNLEHYAVRTARYIMAGIRAEMEYGDLFAIFSRGIHTDDPDVVKMAKIAKQWARREYAKRIKEFIGNDEVFLDALSTALVDQLSRNGPSVISIGKKS